MKVEQESKEDLSSHAELRSAFLAGNISAVELIDALMTLDQAIPTRDHAEDNLRVLNDSEVRSKLAQDPEAIFPLNELLTLTYFHIGQQKLATGDLSAREDFVAALDAGQKIADPEYISWCAYVEATIAYCDRDVDAVRACLERIREGSNQNIVRNMIRGLEHFGTVDYRRDYKSAV